MTVRKFCGGAGQKAKFSVAGDTPEEILTVILEWCRPKLKRTVIFAPMEEGSLDTNPNQASWGPELNRDLDLETFLELNYVYFKYSGHTKILGADTMNSKLLQNLTSKKHKYTLQMNLIPHSTNSASKAHFDKGVSVLLNSETT